MNGRADHRFGGRLPKANLPFASVVVTSRRRGDDVAGLVSAHSRRGPAPEQNIADRDAVTLAIGRHVKGMSVGGRLRQGSEPGLQDRIATLSPIGSRPPAASWSTLSPVTVGLLADVRRLHRNPMTMLTRSVRGTAGWKWMSSTPASGSPGRRDVK